MTSLLIVDDDQYIREGLKRLINWKALHINSIMEAEGAYDALSIMEKTRPHIVLTDIRMPKGDGLHLIDTIRKRKWHTFIVVLSGYNDYQYVRQAMKYQVEDYLLKPVDALELTEIISSCTERFEGQFIEEQLQRESFQLLKNNVLLRWAQRRIQDDQLREKLKFLDIPLLKYDLYQISLIDWRAKDELVLSEQEEQFRSFAILNSVEEALKESRKGIAFLNESRQIIVLFVGDEAEADLFVYTNKRWLNSLASRYSEILKTPWHNYFGNAKGYPSAVHESYGEALASFSPDNNYKTVDNIITPQNPIIHQVEAYVQKHYDEELSLQLLAQRFNVNNVYLGRIFKEEMGQYFNDYLNELRMEHAKKMLSSSSLKASDIAIQVGFLDPNYFFRKFKQLIGMSPSDYRLAHYK